MPRTSVSWTGRRCTRRRASPGRRSSALPIGSSPLDGPSSAGPWGSPSTATPSGRSRRSPTSPSSKATSASQEPDCAPYEDTPTSRVTEAWGSGRSCHRTSRPPWRRSSGSRRPRSADTTRSTRCEPCGTGRPTSSSASAGISPQQRPIPSGPTRRCAPRGSPCRSPQSPTARMSSTAAPRSFSRRWAGPNATSGSTARRASPSRTPPGASTCPGDGWSRPRRTCGRRSRSSPSWRRRHCGVAQPAVLSTGTPWRRTTRWCGTTSRTSFRGVRPMTRRFAGRGASCCRTLLGTTGSSTPLRRKRCSP